MKKVILWVGVVILVLMCFFPPWTEDWVIQGNLLTTKDRGYHCLLRPPEPIARGVGVLKIDTVRLLLQCVVVALPTACLAYSVGKRKSQD
jgi:hypothetical protein